MYLLRPFYQACIRQDLCGLGTARCPMMHFCTFQSATPAAIAESTDLRSTETPEQDFAYILLVNCSFSQVDHRFVTVILTRAHMLLEWNYNAHSIVCASTARNAGSDGSESLLITSSFHSLILNSNNAARAGNAAPLLTAAVFNEATRNHLLPSGVSNALSASKRW